jgi:hypothetical protein
LPGARNTLRPVQTEHLGCWQISFDSHFSYFTLISHEFAKFHCLGKSCNKEHEFFLYIISARPQDRQEANNFQNCYPCFNVAFFPVFIQKFRPFSPNFANFIAAKYSVFCEAPKNNCYTKIKVNTS